MKKSVFSLVAVFVMLFVTQVPTVNAGWKITELGTLGGTSTYANDINNLGQIVGWSETLSGEKHAFLYENGIMQDIGTLGGDYSVATAINNSGQIVGWGPFNKNGVPVHSFLYSNGTLQDLGSGLWSSSLAHDIDNQIVGQWANTTGDSMGTAFLYDNGVWTDLGILEGEGPHFDESNANAINNSGQIVGGSVAPGVGWHAFLYENGVMKDLGTLGGSDSEAYDINNLGQIVGESWTSSGERHAFLYENGVMKDLGTLGGDYSGATAINNSGQIVGFSTESSGWQTHAFLYEKGTMKNLSNMLEVDSSYTTATSLNDLGQILVVASMSNGVWQSFLFTPYIDINVDILLHVPNSLINRRAVGLTPVAILSTKTFRANRVVDENSLTFGHSGNEMSLAFCGKHDLDINWDGYRDLVCYFWTQKAGFQCGDTEGVLKGKTINGALIQGRDTVTIIPCR